jgi:hypothetical protein
MLVTMDASSDLEGPRVLPGSSNVLLWYILWNLDWTSFVWKIPQVVGMPPLAAQ